MSADKAFRQPAGQAIASANPGSAADNSDMGAGDDVPLELFAKFAAAAAGVSISASLTCDLARAIRDCASWHGTPNVLLRGRSPKELMRPLREELGR